MKDETSAVISAQQRKGGRARAKLYTHEQLSRQSKRAWRTRRENALADESISANPKAMCSSCKSKMRQISKNDWVCSRCRVHWHLVMGVWFTGKTLRRKKVTA